MELYKSLNKQYISGEWRDGTGQSRYKDKNPYNEEVLAEFKMAGIEDVKEAYESARKAQKEWENVNPFERSTIMENAVRIMSERRKELVELLVSESALPI